VGAPNAGVVMADIAEDSTTSATLSVVTRRYEGGITHQTHTVSSLGGTPVEALLWGASVAESEIAVHFAGSGEVVDGFTSEGWTAYEIARATDAFALIEAVADVTFTRAPSAAKADFVIGLDTDQLDAYRVLGYFSPPGEPGAGTGNMNGAQWDRFPGGDLERGGTGFVVFTHEILHGLGLAHPHDEGGTSAVMRGVSYPFGDFGDGDLNQGLYTTMSYNTGWNTGDVGTFGALSGDWGYEAGPMALDIAALQALYGANLATRTGDDTYLLPDLNGNGTAWQAIWDAGGTDTIAYDGWRDAVIDLRAATLAYGPGGGGYLSAARSVAGGFTIAHGVVIENARTGGGNDMLFGNDADNILFTGRGNDTAYGGDGADRITAHRGRDAIFGGEGDDWVSAGTGNDTLKGNAGDDTLMAGRGNDTIHGQSGDDTIFGRKGRDAIRGGEGNDTINAGPGNDRVFGGAGNDTITLGFGQDTFVFRFGDGHDRVTDFRLARDHLLLDEALLAGRPLDTLPDLAVREGENLRLTFDSGESLLFNGVTNAERLIDAITLDSFFG
jgi:serralysin